MLKFSQQTPNTEIYPVVTELFERFLGDFGRFIAILLSVDSGFNEWFKEGISLKISHETLLTKNQVIDLLEKAKLTLEDFEAYIFHLHATGTLKSLTEAALKTPPTTLKRMKE